MQAQAHPLKFIFTVMEILEINVMFFLKLNKWIIISFFLQFIWSCQSDYIKELSGGYYYASESKESTAILRHGKKRNERYIPCKIIFYDYNKQFIIAAQEPVRECLFGEIDIDYNNLEVAFWIIDVQKDKILGPYSLDEYIKKRKALGVPEELKLKLEI